MFTLLLQSIQLVPEYFNVIWHKLLLEPNDAFYAKATCAIVDAIDDAMLYVELKIETFKSTK